MATRYKDTYFTTGGVIFHPTKNNSYVANKKTNQNTYVPKTNIKDYPDSDLFGLDYSTQQNESIDVYGSRRYFFPPFSLILEEN